MPTKKASFTKKDQLLNQKKHYIFILFGLGFAIALYSFVYQLPLLDKLLKKTNDSVLTTLPSEQLITTPLSDSLSLTPLMANTQDAQSRFIFLRNPDRDTFVATSAWLMNPDGTGEENLNIPNVLQAYKQPSSSLVFYVLQHESKSKLQTINIMNLNTKISVSLPPLIHQDPEAITYVRIPELGFISPDSTFFIASVDSYGPCKDSNGRTQPSETPCSPKDPRLLNGLYLFDLKSLTKTYLGESWKISRWDTKNHKLYLINFGDNTKSFSVVDLRTKKLQVLEKSISFVSETYPLFKSKQQLKVYQLPQNSLDGSSKLVFSLFNTKIGEEMVILKGNMGDIQTGLTISPDEQYVLFVKVVPNGTNHATYALSVYDLSTKKTRLLTYVKQSPGKTESYSTLGVWIDPNTFITGVDTVELTGQYYNGNNFLIKVNVETGAVDRLTPKDDVYRFIRQ